MDFADLFSAPIPCQCSVSISAGAFGGIALRWRGEKFFAELFHTSIGATR
jgi:hypothetical protein